jgi:hypothetical protein
MYVPIFNARQAGVPRRQTGPRVREDKRGPVTRPRVPRRTGGTFGSRAEILRAERARLCEKSHAVGAFEPRLRPPLQPRLDQLVHGSDRRVPQSLPSLPDDFEERPVQAEQSMGFLK